MIKIYNTLTKKKEKFIPLHHPFVGIYVCGPTVYDDPHLGHAKSYVSFDVIVRCLKAAGYKVRYVQNITDVGHLQDDADQGEDKIQKRAKLEKLEPVEIAQKYENHFFRDMDKLNCLRPNISCRATGHIPEMIQLVEKLIENGYGYVAEGNVYFDVSQFKDYGKLSGKRIEDLKKGVRIEVAEGKKDPVDFALWKKADKDHLMRWQSPWSIGYPGWHLECSVMSMKYLGESIDIHGGGIDNQFPHHECEIAQSEAATGKPFVKYWMHNNMVTVDGQKMSKSLGNFVQLTDLFTQFHPMTVRFFILQGHYRSPQDFSDNALKAAQTGFERMARTVMELRKLLDGNQNTIDKLSENMLPYREKFFEFINDDFNTSGAISVLFDLLKKSNELISHSCEIHELKSIEHLFTLLGEEILGFRFNEIANKKIIGLEAELVDLLINLRQKFREKSDWNTADEIRNNLEELGIILEDGKSNVKWKINR
jgi:cysteinyl-tRNA synthetase